jgi:hypothetical protein
MKGQIRDLYSSDKNFKKSEHPKQGTRRTIKDLCIIKRGRKKDKKLYSINKRRKEGQQIISTAEPRGQKKNKKRSIRHKERKKRHYKEPAGIEERVKIKLDIEGKNSGKEITEKVIPALSVKENRAIKRTHTIGRSEV